MGEPLECEHGNPDNGDTLQQTTTGLAFYRQYTSTPTFTNGWDHWAWTASGLVYWVGNSIDPPGVFVPTPLEPSGGGESPSAPSDLQVAIDFLAGYQSQVPRMDEIVATLSAMTSRTSYQAMPANVLGSYSGGWITLNTDLQSETLAVVAMVLAHEGQHALDDLNGLLGPGQACYDAEVRAFTVQVLLWSSIYGIDGKPAPLTGIEGNFNYFLDQFLRSPLTFVETIIALYGEQCG